MMDWRKWTYERLLATPALLAVVPAEQIYGAGALTGDPKKKPFVTLMFGIKTPELMDGDVVAAYSQDFTLWAYDDAGTYETIDNILTLARTALVGQVVAPSAIGCVWQSDSGDLADDTYAALTKNSSYRLVGGN